MTPIDARAHLGSLVGKTVFTAAAAMLSLPGAQLLRGPTRVRLERK